MFVFRPKEGGEPYTASLMRATDGCDLVLTLDKVDQTPDSGFMIEIWVNPDGSMGGQITTRPGFDPVALFTCTKDRLAINGPCGGPAHVITDPYAEAA